MLPSPNRRRRSSCGKFIFSDSTVLTKRHLALYLGLAIHGLTCVSQELGVEREPNAGLTLRPRDLRPGRPQASKSLTGPVTFSLSYHQAQNLQIALSLAAATLVRIGVSVPSQDRGCCALQGATRQELFAVHLRIVAVLSTCLSLP